ncbi:MAG: hypothetical protein ACOX9C_06295 [Kiritimatiellia bacterium]|jgi:hypothetical protein
MQRLRNLYIGIVLAAFAAPLLCVTGLRGIVKVAGVEHKAQPPPVSAKAFLDGSFQNGLRTYYERKHFGRGELLKFKHLVFEIINLGQYHAGYSGNVIQGRKGFLFERPYLDVRFNPPTRHHTPAHHRQFAETAAALRDAIEARGVAFGVILAPSKPEACPGLVPARYHRFSRAPADFDLYAGLSDALDSVNIPHVNGKTLCGPFLDTDALFPYTGTHWSVYCAALAATNLIGRLNAANPTNALPAPVVLGMAYQPEPYESHDRDIADLLNLPFPYRRDPDRYPHPIFGPPPARPGKAVVLGDSFCDQLLVALQDSGACHDIVMISNKLPTREILESALADADLVIYAYSAHALARNRVPSEMRHALKTLDEQKAVGRPPMPICNRAGDGADSRLGGKRSETHPGD